MSGPRATIHSARKELFEATPPQVWRGYFADGYTYAQAVDEELSYAESEERPAEKNRRSA